MGKTGFSTPHNPEVVGSSPASATRKEKVIPTGMAFFFSCYAMAGREPIYMQVSGGHLLPPVQKLVSSLIFLFLTEKEKCKSSPASAARKEIVIPTVMAFFTFKFQIHTVAAGKRGDICESIISTMDWFNYFISANRQNRYDYGKNFYFLPERAA